MKICSRNVLQYTLVILLVYLSGNIFFMSINYNVAVISVLVFTVITYLLIKSDKKYVFSIQSVLAFIFFTISITSTVLFNNEINYSSYIAIYLQIVIAILSVKIISIDRFKILYSNIIVFLAGTSLLFHFLAIMYPSVVFLFPKTDALVSVEYYNAFIHIYQALVGYGRFVFHTRNAGIFWEPGAYQAFLNIGLIFILDYISISEIKNKKHRVSIFILLITILSTYSATGYIILGLIIIAYRKKIFKIFSAKGIGDVFFALIFVFLGFSFISGEIQAALGLINSKYLSGSSNIIQRVSLDKLELLFDPKAFFIGISFTEYFKITSAIWNSIIQTAVVMGVPFTLILLLRYFKSSYYFTNRRLLFFIILIIIFSAENLIWRPFFLYFAFSELNVKKVIEKDKIG